MLVFHACWLGRNVTKAYKDAFIGCYAEKYTGMDTLINISGFYKEISIYNRPHSDYYDKHPNEYRVFYEIDTVQELIIFFDDGIFVRGFTNYEFLNSILTCPANQKYFEKSFNWGIYKINQDTLSMFCINYTTFGAPERQINKYTYLIHNKETLKCLDHEWYSRNGCKMEVGQDTIFDFPAQFEALKSLPNSDCWLKKNRWFWCDEEKYNEYMSRNKER